MSSGGAFFGRKEDPRFQKKRNRSTNGENYDDLHGQP